MKTVDSRRSPVGADSPEAAAAKHTNYSGAVYGSMLAASVVATAGVSSDFTRFKLVAMLIITGLVFWAAHVYARWAGERQLSGNRWSWQQISRIASQEWPIVEAAFLPTLAVAVSPVFGLDLTGAAWLALAVAVTQQVGWACLGAIRAAAPALQVVAECAVNLVLGVILMAAKVVVGH